MYFLTASSLEVLRFSCPLHIAWHAKARSCRKNVFAVSAKANERVVDFEFGLVFAEAHLFDAVVEGLVFGDDPFELAFGSVFVVEVEVGEAFAGLAERPEVRCESTLSPGLDRLVCRFQVHVRFPGCLL